MVKNKIRLHTKIVHITRKARVLIIDSSAVIQIPAGHTKRREEKSQRIVVWNLIWRYNG